MILDNNQQAFFALVRAGLWGEEVRLLPYHDIDYGIVSRMAEDQSVVGLIADGLNHVTDVKAAKRDVLQFVGKTLLLEQHNLEMNTYINGLMNRLWKEGVYSVLVKGQGVAQCYEHPLWRAAGDIDLLLDAENYEKAKLVLLPHAEFVETEFSFFKHVGMTLDGWEVELHGTFRSRLSKRIDDIIDKIQEDVFKNGEVRVWRNVDTDVLLPAPDVDVIFVFTHFIHHFFFEGIGLRQICDWCRLLWTYRESINRELLERRINSMGLMSEWKSFAAFAVDWLGMPPDSMPFYSSDARWRKKASRIKTFVLKVGNMGHNQSRQVHERPYLWRKFVSFWGRLADMLRHFIIFPKDSIVFFGGVIRSGMHAAVRGE